MKRLGLLSCLLMMVTLLSACNGTMSTSKTSRGGLVAGTFENVAIASKDFMSVGLVFAETDIADTGSSVMTYDALLKEARKLNADAIVNVVIEDVRVCDQTTGPMVNKSNCQTKRYGSALAIKYTNALTIQNITSDTKTVLNDSDANNERQQQGNLFRNMFNM